MKTIKKLKSYAKNNKKRDVVSESFFRGELQRKGVHYQRQKVIFTWIVDFYLPKRNLIVEIDGKDHLNKIEKDKKRQKSLESYGWKVIRFTNNEVFDDVEGCVAKIIKLYPERKEFYKECKERLKFINAR